MAETAEAINPTMRKAEQVEPPPQQVPPPQIVEEVPVAHVVSNGAPEESESPDDGSDDASDVSIKHWGVFWWLVRRYRSVTLVFARGPLNRRV